MTATTFTSTTLAKLAPFLTPANDPTGDHAKYISALCAPFEDLYALAMDQGDPDDVNWIPGWSSLLDVDNCKTAYLPFLAQFVGTTIPAGSSDAVARQIVRNESNQHRGTPTAIISAAQRNLTGTQTVFLLERRAADGSTDAYQAVLLFRAAECPNQPQLISSVEAVKPGGIRINYVTSAGFPWNSAIHIWSADTFSWNAADSTQP